MLKITKMSISPQRFDRTLRYFVRLCQLGLLTAPTEKKQNFKNPTWQTAAILKTAKLSYLCNVLTDFDLIWHCDACWSPAPDVKFNFFTADAMHPRYQPWAFVCVCLCLSVSVSVCLSVTSRSSTKTAKRRITQTTPHDSQFSDAKDLREIRPGSPPTKAPNAGGVGQNRRLLTNNRLYIENGTRQTHTSY